MSQYFPKPYEHFGEDINFKADLSNYATKADLRNATGTDRSKLTAKSDLVSLKAEVYKLDIDKLVPVPVDLGKLSDVVKNDVVKKKVYNKLVTKVNNIDTSGFVLKTKGRLTKADFDTKLTSLNRKINSNKTKNFLVENELKNLKIFDSSYFQGQSHLEEDGAQNDLVF